LFLHFECCEQAGERWRRWRAALVVQKFVRRFLAQRCAEKRRAQVVIIQKLIRGINSLLSSADLVFKIGLISTHQQVTWLDEKPSFCGRICRCDCDESRKQSGDYSYYGFFVY
jgi:hypothetical protein